MLRPLSARWALAAICGGIVSSQTAIALTESEAASVVAAEAFLENEIRMERAARLQEVPAFEQRVFHHPAAKVLIRAVAPPPPASEALNQAAIPEVTTIPPADVKLEENFTFIISAGPGGSRVYSAGNRELIRVAEDVDLTWLPAFVTVETPGARYGFMSIVQPSEGHPPAPSSLSEDSTVGQAIDLLLQHYVANQAQYEAEMREAKAIAVARERYQRENPAPPRETVINFWHGRREETTLAAEQQ